MFLIQKDVTTDLKNKLDNVSFWIEWANFEARIYL